MSIYLHGSRNYQNVQFVISWSMAHVLKLMSYAIVACMYAFEIYIMNKVHRKEKHTIKKNIINGKFAFKKIKFLQLYVYVVEIYFLHFEILSYVFQIKSNPHMYHIRIPYTNICRITK